MKKRLNLATVYEDFDRNVGRIVRFEGNLAVVSINAGRGGHEVMFEREQLLFTPKGNDRVLLCIDENSGRMYLQELKKTRQENR